MQEPSRADVPLMDLIEEWLDAAAAAQRIGVPESRIGRLLVERRLAGIVLDRGRGVRIPAAFFADGEIVKGVSGIITVLGDGGYDDEEILTWMFTEDPTLPGRPIDALRENRGSEAKRRAQAMA